MTNWLRVVALVGLTTSVSSCDLYFSKLQFVNGTASQVVGLTISDGRTTWRLGTLDRGERTTFSGHLGAKAARPLLGLGTGRRSQERAAITPRAA
jgi:hypothetical protein